MRSWANNPRYMRAQQKIAALRPEHLAILQTVSADASFADEAMRRQIQSMITKTGNVGRQRDFDLRKKIASDRATADAKNLKYNKKQGKRAFGLGVANLGLSTIGGIKQRKRDEEMTDYMYDMKKRYQLAGISPELEEQPGIGLKRRGGYSPFTGR